MFAEKKRRLNFAVRILGAIFGGVLASSLWAQGTHETPTMTAPTPTVQTTAAATQASAKVAEQEITIEEGATATPTTATRVLEAAPVAQTEEASSPETTATVPAGSPETTGTPAVSVTDTPTPEETPEVSTETPTGTETATEIATETLTDTSTEWATPSPTETTTATSTEVPEAVEAEASPEAEATVAVEKNTNILPGRRVGLTPEWFDYLMGAGYLARSASAVARLGVIAESSNQEASLLVGYHLVIRQRTKESVKVGDRLVAYRVLDSYHDPLTGQYLGVYIKNLAVLKVVRVDRKLIQADVIQEYSPFYKGEPVKPYEDELDRWKQSRRKRPLPADPIDCTVAGFIPGTERALMNEPVILGAGEDQGVVAGMDFELRQPVEASVGQTSWMKAGKARVFYVGPKYSMAKVLWDRIPIVQGFRAVYEP